MTKFAAFLFIFAWRSDFRPPVALVNNAPFASNYPYNQIIRVTPFPATPPRSPAKIIWLSGTISKHKVILNWIVGENETADKFEIEKSSDGKIFTMSALVFGTDKPETGNYQFFEKAGNKKTMYRIKLINKNRQAEYSSVIEIKPTG